MAPGAQCAEDGPFFATTPRSVIQNGMAISQDILIMPDWLLIGLMMASLLLLMIILVIGLVSAVSIDRFFCIHSWLLRPVIRGINSLMVLTKTLTESEYYVRSKFWRLILYVLSS